MKYLFLFIILFTGEIADAQKINYDALSFVAPKGWTKEEKTSLISYTRIDNLKGTWCRVIVYKSTNSKGSLDADFNSEWQELVVKPYAISAKPELTILQEEKGWKFKSGVAKYKFNNMDAIAMLTTMSSGLRCASIVATTSDESYMKDIENFMGSVEIIGNSSGTQVKTENPKSVPIANTGKFAFTTTNFDDGWVSTVKEDWVEVAKGDIKIILHYPNTSANIIGDPEPRINNAWNVLVAPRYRDLSNYRVFSTTLDYLRPYLGYGQVRDASGKLVFVALFSRGQTGWIEFITSGKNAFVQFAGFDPERIDHNVGSDTWRVLENMSTYNKFAVAASDLKGSWTSDYSGMLSYYSIYNGANVGNSVHQSSETFEFLAGNNYNWKLLAINGMMGSTKYDHAANTGKFTVPNNWQISFSNLEGKPKTFNAQFSCIKGGRLLWMEDAQYKNGFTVYGLAK